MNLISGASTGGNVRLFSLARYALLEALKLSGASSAQKVLVPAFICRDLLAAVHSAGAETIYYPVDRSLAPQSLLAEPGVKAVIAVNYFGFPQALESFEAYCSAHGAALIEDNAHGFLSCDDKGTPLGSRGDLGIFSLRKTFMFPDGAALVVNRQGWIGSLPDPIPCRGDPLPPGFLIKRALGRIQNATGIRARNAGEQIARRIRRARTGSALPVPLPEAERQIPGAPAIHCESLRMLRQVDAGREVARRRMLFQDFHRELGRLAIEPVFRELPDGVAPYGYPFRAAESDAAAVVRVAGRRGFDCFRWPDLPDAVAPVAPDYYRNVWWVNFLC